MKIYLSMLLPFIFTGCASLPKDVKPVNDFQVERYLGTWHEIARLDHYFERGLVDATAEYSMRDDGGLKVVNRGLSMKKKNLHIRKEHI